MRECYKFPRMGARTHTPPSRPREGIPGECLKILINYAKTNLKIFERVKFECNSGFRGSNDERFVDSRHCVASNLNPLDSHACATHTFMYETNKYMKMDESARVCMVRLGIDHQVFIFVHNLNASTTYSRKFQWRCRHKIHLYARRSHFRNILMCFGVALTASPSSHMGTPLRPRCEIPKTHKCVHALSRCVCVCVRTLLFRCIKI